jgi:hypothetical protein
MALSIPTYLNPFDPANAITNAYGWISLLSLDLFAEKGRVVLSINPNASAWEATPIDTITMALGQIVEKENPSASPPIAGVAIVTLAELLAETATIGSTGITFAEAFGAIGQRLYVEAIKLPPLAAATQV